MLRTVTIRARGPAVLDAGLAPALPGSVAGFQLVFASVLSDYVLPHLMGTTRFRLLAPTLYDGPDEWNRIHGHNERCSVRSIQWGVRVLYDVVERFAAG